MIPSLRRPEEMRGYAPKNSNQASMSMVGTPGEAVKMTPEMHIKEEVIE